MSLLYWRSEGLVNGYFCKYFIARTKRSQQAAVSDSLVLGATQRYFHKLGQDRDTKVYAAGQQGLLARYQTRLHSINSVRLACLNFGTSSVIGVYLWQKKVFKIYFSEMNGYNTTVNMSVQCSAVL